MFGKPKKPQGNSQGPAYQMLDIIVNTLNEKNLKYNLDDERPVVRLNFRGDNIESQTFTLIVDEDGESVALRVFSIYQFEKGQLADAYEFCNRVNNQYRWMRFYVDSDDELTAAIDAVVSPESAGEECYEIIGRAVDIVDSVYGEMIS